MGRFMSMSIDVHRCLKDVYDEKSDLTLFKIRAKQKSAVLPYFGTQFLVFSFSKASLIVLSCMVAYLSDIIGD